MSRNLGPIKRVLSTVVVLELREIRCGSLLTLPTFVLRIEVAMSTKRVVQKSAALGQLTCLIGVTSFRSSGHCEAISNSCEENCKMTIELKLISSSS